MTMVAPAPGLSTLAAVVGPAAIRPGSVADSIDGITPEAVVVPDSVEAAARALAGANQARLRIAPRGGGTKIDWGARPTGVDLVLSTERLNRVIEHAAGDMTVVVQAGVRLADLQAELARADQFLALDPPWPERATVGGLIATNDSGPRRLRYGSLRDMLIGITIARADGTLARGGGKVVKNVAGYDLPKLFTGSLGTLGLIVEAVFRLYPRPPASRTLLLEGAAPDAVQAAVLKLLNSALVPSAMEVICPAVGSAMYRLAVRFETVATAADAQVQQAERLLTQPGIVKRVLSGGEESGFWSEVDALWTGGQAIVKLTVLPGQVAAALQAIEEAAARSGQSAAAGGRAGNGVLFAFLSGDDDAVVAAVEWLRERMAAMDGRAVVQAAPVAVKERVDVWGPPGDALPLMRRVKAEFDPKGILNPGRFVGGI